MKKVLIFLLSSFCFVATHGAQQSEDTLQSGAAEKEAPVLHIDAPSWNFGDVPRKGGDVSHDFVFRNDGGAPLVVLRVVTSCSCVKASFPKRPVAPGESGTIRITYEPHKSEPGTFSKVIQIISNAGRDVVTVRGTSLDEDPKVKIKNDKLKIK